MPANIQLEEDLTMKTKRSSLFTWPTILAIIMLSTACSHRAVLSETDLIPPQSVKQHPLTVGVYIDPGICTHTDKEECRVGASTHHIEVVSGEKIEHALELVAETCFRKAIKEQEPSIGEGQNALIEFRFNGEPNLSCAWYAGWVNVGAECTYVLPVKASLSDPDQKVIWTDSVVASAQYNSKQAMVNTPNANDFYPAVNVAIDNLMKEMCARISGITIPVPSTYTSPGNQQPSEGSNGLAADTAVIDPIEGLEAGGGI
jgi:hypothetical protein